MFGFYNHLCLQLFPGSVHKYIDSFLSNNTSEQYNSHLTHSQLAPLRGRCQFVSVHCTTRSCTSGNWEDGKRKGVDLITSVSLQHHSAYPQWTCLHVPCDLTTTLPLLQQRQHLRRVLFSMVSQLIIRDKICLSSTCKGGIEKEVVVLHPDRGGRVGKRDRGWGKKKRVKGDCMRKREGKRAAAVLYLLRIKKKWIPWGLKCLWMAATEETFCPLIMNLWARCCRAMTSTGPWRREVSCEATLITYNKTTTLDYHNVQSTLPQVDQPDANHAASGKQY